MSKSIIKTGISLSGFALAVLFGTSALVTPTHAAGGGSGGESSPVPTCKRKMVWSKTKKKCVQVKKVNAKKCKKRSLFSRKCKNTKKSTFLDDDNIYEAARDLAYNRRYQEAITLLNLASNKNDPRILNYLGYSNRKLGRIEKGLGYYQAALKVDPDYTLVMEYMGEAFLQLNQVDKARQQLSEIQKRCGIDCREYSMLKSEIDRHLTK
ncbi:MAG: tetratricopeptide repeat protein [Rhizobiaceae bacterium]